MVNRLYLLTPRCRIIEQAHTVQRRRLELAAAIAKGLVPPDTPTTSLSRRRRRCRKGSMSSNEVCDGRALSALTYLLGVICSCYLCWCYLLLLLVLVLSAHGTVLGLSAPVISLGVICSWYSLRLICSCYLCWCYMLRLLSWDYLLLLLVLALSAPGSLRVICSYYLCWCYLLLLQTWRYLLLI